MTQHIEEARKPDPCGWLVKPKGSANVGTFFDHEPHFGNCENWDREDYEVNPLYDAAALAAAEERGRIEEREMQTDINIAVEQRNMTITEMQSQTDRAEAAEARIAELEKRLADAERVIEPFAPIAAVYDGHEDSDPIWAGFVAGVQKRITVGHLRAARAYMEGK